MHDLDELSHLGQHHLAEHLDPLRLAFDPDFPSVRLWHELIDCYGFVEARIVWRGAAAIWRDGRHMTPERPLKRDQIVSEDSFPESLPTALPTA